MHNIAAASSALLSQEETVIQIPLSELYPFPNHPFQIRDDEAMRGMLESVHEYGVLTPVIVRSREGGGYEIIAGHRRKHASEIAGLETMPAIVREMDVDSATILMVDSNIQREDVLPSEKAETYKMKMAALKRKAGRPPKENCGQVEHNFKGKRTRDIIAEQTGENGSKVQCYINLTNLCPTLLKLVDTKQIAFHAAVALSHLKSEEQSLVVEFIEKEQTIPTLQQAQQLKKASQKDGLDQDTIFSITPAVELSYLKPEEQTLVVETIESEQATPSLSQAQRLKKKSQAGELNEDTVLSIMSEEKKPEKYDLTISGDKLRKYFPRSYTPRQMEDTILKLLEGWQRKRSRNQER